MACTETLYINGVTDTLARIARIDAIILALEGQLAAGAGTADLTSYTLDDGQTKISTQYRGIPSIIAGLKGLDALRTRLINQLNGRQKVLRPWQGLR